MTDDSCWTLAAAALAGRRTLRDCADEEREACLEWARRHRLAGLLWDVAGPAHDRWADAARRQAAYAVYQERELRRVVEAFVYAGVSPVFLKGTALAYTIYPDAALRPGVDHDMLVRPNEAPLVRAVFERLGYEPELQPPGEFITSQFAVRRADARAVPYLFDVHLKISNALVYADRLTYDEILADAAPMPRLDARALAPSAGHSLVLACVHRVAHHADSADLLWLYDIHLLARSLAREEWAAVLAFTEVKQLCAVVHRGIVRAEEALGPAAPVPVLQQLADLACREPSSPFVGAGARPIDIARTDFQALGTSRARLQWLAEHLAPPASYMRRIYPRCPTPLLPFAYAYRIARGAPSWFRPR